jgi:hypothetical protein
LSLIFAIPFSAGPAFGQSSASIDRKVEPPSKPAASKTASQPSLPKAGTAKPAPKAVASKPTLKPIVHDFSSLLGAQAKTATPAQLKNIVAFVSSDKNESYVATVQTLTPDYAIVTNPVPTGETAVSVLIGSKDGKKPSISVRLSTEVTKDLVITGDFGTLSKLVTSPHCGGVPGCAVLLEADDVTIVDQAEVTALEVSPTRVSVTYTAPATATPNSIRIQNPAAHFPTITLVFPKTPSQNQTVPMRQAIAGDFCQEGLDHRCTTEFFKYDAAHPPSCPDAPKCLVTDTYVLEAGDSVFQQAQLNALGEDTADVSFSAPPGFKPAYLVLVTKGQTYRFAYTPAPEIRTSDLNFESDELDTVCDETTQKIPDCDNTPASRFQLTSISSVKTLSFVALHNNIIVAQVTAAVGQEPNAIIVFNTQTNKSTIARRAVKPGGNSKLLNVTMSIMDQVTAQRNYGNRIAKRYIAVTLDVHNPTATKVQFNKSALYFDVDYVEAREQGPSWGGFRDSLGEISTLGLYQPSVYKAPFVAGAKKNSGARPRVARFGLEQNVQQAPENYLSVLGSFDYTTTKTDDKLKAVELLGSVLTNIATGGIVADASGAFKAGATVFASTFLPGVRSIALDTSFINRLRSNLVAQTLQDTIQVPAGGSTTTVVLLPRAGILSFTDAQVPVMIKRVLDVHLVEEVVNSAPGAPTKKAECTVGSTKDQIRQALGEPTGLTTNADGSSSFSYSMGPIASVSFNANGVVDSCPKPRTATEQMDLVKTLVEAKQTLTDLELSGTSIDLVDSSTVLVDIPGVSKTYHFDSKGNIASPYVFLFKPITAQGALADETQVNFESYLESIALTPARKSEIAAQATSNKGKGKAGTSLTYASPDIDNGSVTVAFKGSGTGASATVVVDKDKITFQGDQPKNTK